MPLGQISEVRRQRDQIATSGICCKISPRAGRHIHSEGAQAPVQALWIKGDIFCPLNAAVRQPTIEKQFNLPEQECERRRTGGLSGR